MKIVFDTNVLLDILAERQPFVSASLAAVDIIDKPGVSGAMTANTVTDLFFLYRKHEPDNEKRKAAIRGLMTALEVLDTNRALCLLALDSHVDDFEDALLVESASAWSADYIVTRNTGDFTKSSIEAITPQELISRLGD